MSRTLPVVDRETASALNPFIGTQDIRDSLDMMADLVSEIGCLLTSADSPEPSRLWPVFHAMAIAMCWESEAISRARKEQNHV